MPRRLTEDKSDRDDLPNPALTDRIGLVCGQRTVAEISRMIEINPETVRRYVKGDRPSAEFLSRLCAVFGINGHWLLTGDGVMLCDQMPTAALGEADVSTLIAALAERLRGIEGRTDRIVERIERAAAGSRAAMPAIEVVRRRVPPNSTKTY